MEAEMREREQARVLGREQEQAQRVLVELFVPALLIISLP